MTVFVLKALGCGYCRYGNLHVGRKNLVGKLEQGILREALSYDFICS